MREQIIKDLVDHIKESGFYHEGKEGNHRIEAGSSMIKFTFAFSVQQLIK